MQILVHPILLRQFLLGKINSFNPRYFVQWQNTPPFLFCAFFCFFFWRYVLFIKPVINRIRYEPTFLTRGSS
jgi:hypothetical protein